MYAYADFVVIHYTYIESIEDGGTNKSYTYMYVKIDKKKVRYFCVMWVIYNQCECLVLINVNATFCT